MGSYSYAIMVFYKYITLSGLVFIFAFIPKGLNVYRINQAKSLFDPEGVVWIRNLVFL